jgi:DNA gyrase/topoisomerase IV subunit B
MKKDKLPNPGETVYAFNTNLFQSVNPFWVIILTPLVVAKKGKEILYFYSNEEYRAWETKTDIKKYEIEYKKGLASLESSEYEEILQNPRLLQIKNDPLYRVSLKNWFGKDSAPRKEALLKL